MILKITYIYEYYIRYFINTESSRFQLYNCDFFFYFCQKAAK